MFRLWRVIPQTHLSTIFFQPKNFRSLSSISQKKENDLGIDTEIYKPSTAKEATHVPDDLHSGQPRETFDSPPRPTATLTGSGKVW